MSSVTKILAKHHEDVKDERKGVGRSRARRLMGLREMNPKIKTQHDGARVAQPIGGAITMHDETPMIFFDDGSLRRLMSKKMSRSQKKALKKARQHGKN